MNAYSYATSSNEGSTGKELFDSAMMRPRRTYMYGLSFKSAIYWKLRLGIKSGSHWMNGIATVSGNVLWTLWATLWLRDLC